jgi:hypothetical protein
MRLLNYLQILLVLRGRTWRTHEVANDTKAQANRVVAGCVCPDAIPSSSLVSVAILSDDEAFGFIWKYQND